MSKTDSQVSAGFSVKNTTANLFSQFFLSGVSFFITPLVIYKFGAPLFGVLALCIQITMISLNFGQSFISALQREGICSLPEGGDAQKQILGTSMVLSMGFALVTGLIFWMVYAFVLEELISPEYFAAGRFLFVILAVAQVLMHLLVPWEAMILISGRIYVLTWGMFIGNVCLSALLFFALREWTAGLLWLGFCFGYHRLLGLAGSVVYFYGGHGSSVPHFSVSDFSVKTAKNITAFSSQITIAMMASLIFYAADSIIIAMLPSLGEADITYYRVAQRWDNFIRMMTVGVSSGMMPAILSKFPISDDTELLSIIRNGVKYVLIIAMLPAVFLFLYAEAFFSIWLGNEFVGPSTPLLKLLMVSVIICAPGRILHGVNMGLREIKWPVRVVLFFALVNIPLSILLGEKLGLGLWGICMATVCCMVLSTWINTILAIRNAGLPFRRVVSPVLSLLGWIPLAWGIWKVLNKMLPCTSLIQLAMHAFIFTVVFSCYTWIFVLKNQERMQVSQYLRLKRVKS